MSDAPPAPEPTAPPAPEPERSEPPDENLVGEAKRKQAAAEKEAKELRARLEELEDRDKSETERERKAREKAEARVAELEQTLTKTQRSNLVRSAASKAGFDDPEDAVVFLASKDIEDAADAERAVKALAKDKPRLLKNQGDDVPPEIGKVVENGRTVEGKKAQGAVLQAEEEAKMLAERLKSFVRS